MHLTKSRRNTARYSEHMSSNPHISIFIANIRRLGCNVPACMQSNLLRSPRSGSQLATRISMVAVVTRAKSTQVWRRKACPEALLRTDMIPDRARICSRERDGSWARVDAHHILDGRQGSCLIPSSVYARRPRATATSGAHTPGVDAS
jgi:hypothetical protein